MKPIDLLGFGPKREAIQNEKGWLVTVTPSEWSGFTESSSIQLTNDQYARYRQWLDNGSLIQHVLSELTMAQREILMSGIGDQEFHQACADPGDDD